MVLDTTYDLIIIGAGPGGLMAAVQASKMGLSFLLLEKNDRPGKKLLSTGGGQCNITHLEPLKEFLSHYHEKSHFASKSIRKFPPQQLVHWFEKQGVPIEITDQGKAFPRSRRASDVLGALTRNIHNMEERIICNTSVKEVVKQADCFQVSNGQKSWHSECVLIATGGQSYPSLGTTGDGYGLAEKLGHSVVAPRPGLAAVEIENFPLEGLAGLGLRNRSMTQWRAGKKMREIQGDLLVTHDGISGPVVLNHARHFLPYDILTLNLTDNMDLDSYQRWLQDQTASGGKMTVRSVVRGMFRSGEMPQRLLEKVFQLGKIPVDLSYGNLSRQQRKSLAQLMTAFPFTVKQVKGYDAAMVTAGGIATEDVVGSTLASKLVEGLFFSGEVLDVDGMSGGYNLQFAFSSGYVAAASILTSLGARGDMCEAH